MSTQIPIFVCVCVRRHTNVHTHITRTQANSTWSGTCADKLSSIRRLHGVHALHALVAFRGLCGLGYMRTRQYACARVVYTCVCTYIYVCILVYVCECVIETKLQLCHTCYIAHSSPGWRLLRFLFLCTYMHVYTHTRIYIYIYTHTHTHTYIHVFMYLRMFSHTDSQHDTPHTYMHYTHTMHHTHTLPKCTTYTHECMHVWQTKHTQTWRQSRQTHLAARWLPRAAAADCPCM